MLQAIAQSIDGTALSWAAGCCLVAGAAYATLRKKREFKTRFEASVRAVEAARNDRMEHEARGGDGKRGDGSDEGDDKPMIVDLKESDVVFTDDYQDDDEASERNSQVSLLCSSAVL